MTTVTRARLTKWVGPLWLSILVGALGSLTLVAAGSSIGSNPQPTWYRWWLWLPEGNYATAHVVFYAGVALLTIGWLGVGVHAFEGHFSRSRAWTTLAAWGVPLLVGVPVFSRDVYSYIAEGQLVRLGFNPYQATPRFLAPGVLLDSIAGPWRDTTSPYGPLFVVLSHAGVSVAGPSLMIQVIVFRLIEFAGVALLMVTLPALARSLNASPGVALWLGVLSPLALFSAVNSAHNDTLMMGLMILALVLARRGSRRWALVALGTAATIKLPALAAVAFITASSLRNAPTEERSRILIEAALIPAAVVTTITVVAGYGWGWLSPSALKIPTEIRVLTTPVVSLAHFVAGTLGVVGLHTRASLVTTLAQWVAEVIAVAIVVTLLVRTRSTNVTRYLGGSLLVVVICSPTVWPWYYLWGLTVLAATSAQRSRFLAAIAALAMLTVGAGGSPMIGGNGIYVTGPLIVGGTIWFWRSGQWRRVLNGVDRVE